MIQGAVSKKRWILQAVMGFFAGKSVAVLNESVCDCLYMCVGCLSGEPDACVVFCSGGCTY